MAKTLQFRRDTTTNLASVTGAVGELFVDTTKKTVVVMDGTTAGGHPLALEGAGGLDNVTSNTAGIFFDATATTSSTFTLVSGFSNDYMSGSSATWSDNNVLITGTSGNNNAAQLLDLVVGDTLTVDFGAGDQVLTLSSVFTVTPGMFPSYTATVVENSPSMSFMQGDIVADHSASTTITPLIIDGTGSNISVGTIGDVYYANNIISPIPTVANTTYGTIITVPPLVINGPLNVLSANTPNTSTVFTLSGSQTSGGNSGGVNNFGTQHAGNTVDLSFNNLGSTVYNAIGQIKEGDVLTIIGTNGSYTGTFDFTVTRVTRTVVGGGDFPGWAVIYGTTTDSRISSSNFNANTIICNRPYVVSEITGGLTAQHLTASQVVSDNLKATKTLDVEGTLSSSITEKRGLAGAQLYTNTGDTNLNLSSHVSDFFSVTMVTNGSGHTLNHLYLSTPWTGGETSERTITVKIGTYGDNNCSWDFSASDAVHITQYTEDGLDSNYQTAPMVWKNGTKTGTFTLGRTYYMTLKVFNSGGYLDQILASIDEYY